MVYLQDVKYCSNFLCFGHNKDHILDEPLVGCFCLYCNQLQKFVKTKFAKKAIYSTAFITDDWNE